ncbi:MAG: hypothetical protein WCI72_04680 [archaeon]
MVSQKARERMTEYIVGRLEDSGIHVARQVARDCLQLQTNGEKNAYVFLHTTSEGADKFVHRPEGVKDSLTLNSLVYRKHYVANIFYKDGKNFFVPIDEEKKNRLAATTMKNYSYDEVSRMVVLRKKEEAVLHLQDPKRLVYYQPDNTAEGGRLHEGLVSFTFKPVQTSYEHKPITARGYDFIMADDGRTLDTRVISGDKTLLNGKLQLKFSRKRPHLPVLGNAPNDLTQEEVDEVFRVVAEDNFGVE